MSLAGPLADVSVDRSDASGAVPGALSYEQALAACTPAPRRRRSGDDHTVLYTGGTTGMPKGVVSRIGPHVAGIIAAAAPMVGVDPSVALDDVPAVAARTVAAGAQIVGLPACPLMHGTGMGIGAVPPMAYGGCVVTLTGRRFDPDELWATVAAEGVAWAVIVGDPFARPMLQALRAGVDAGRPYDTSSLRVIGSSGAMFSAEVRAGLLELLPGVVILDYIASSEGTMGVALSHAGSVVPTAQFTPAAGVKVFTEDDREVARGSGERGLVALSVGVPEGYFHDEQKSAATFRVVDGVRYSFPGDWATVEADGNITLLGRGSQCIITGGEKVFPQEVEEAIKGHGAVEDCLVFGVPDERFGQRVSVVASLAPGTAADEADIIADAGQRLSAFKLPKTLKLVPVDPPGGQRQSRLRGGAGDVRRTLRPQPWVAFGVGRFPRGRTLQPHGQIEALVVVDRLGDPGAVGEVDDRDHRSGRRRGVVTGPVQGPAGVEGGVPGGQGSVRALGEAPLVDDGGEPGLGLVGDPGHAEIAQLVAPRGERHRPHLGADVGQRHPHGDGVVGVEGPVALVLVPRGGAAAGLLDEGLIVVEPHAVDAHEGRRRGREAGIEDERPDGVVEPPHVHGLQEGPAVGVAFLERRHPGRAAGGGRLDDRSDGRHLVPGGQGAHHAVAVASEVGRRPGPLGAVQSTTVHGGTVHAGTVHAGTGVPPRRTGNCRCGSFWRTRPVGGPWAGSPSSFSAPSTAYWTM